MAKRGLTDRIPIWARVPGIIAVVLVAVLISPLLLDAVGVASRSGGGGDHGPGEETEIDDGHGDRNGERGGGDHGSGDRGRSGDGHDSEDDMDREEGGHGTGRPEQREDHDERQGGPAAPPARQPAAATKVVTLAVADIAVMSPQLQLQRGGRR